VSLEVLVAQGGRVGAIAAVDEEVQSADYRNAERADMVRA
jgi:hypothetical protein